MGTHAKDKKKERQKKNGTRGPWGREQKLGAVVASFLSLDSFEGWLDSLRPTAERVFARFFTASGLAVVLFYLGVAVEHILAFLGQIAWLLLAGFRYVQVWRRTQAEARAAKQAAEDLVFFQRLDAAGSGGRLHSGRAGAKLDRRPPTKHKLVHRPGRAPAQAGGSRALAGASSRSASEAGDSASEMGDTVDEVVSEYAPSTMGDWPAAANGTAAPRQPAAKQPEQLQEEAGACSSGSVGGHAGATSMLSASHCGTCPAEQQGAGRAAACKGGAGAAGEGAAQLGELPATLPKAGPPAAEFGTAGASGHASLPPKGRQGAAPQQAQHRQPAGRQQRQQQQQQERHGSLAPLPHSGEPLAPPPPPAQPSPPLPIPLTAAPVQQAPAGGPAGAAAAAGKGGTQRPPSSSPGTDAGQQGAAKVGSSQSAMRMAAAGDDGAGSEFGAEGSPVKEQSAVRERGVAGPGVVGLATLNGRDSPVDLHPYLFPHLRNQPPPQTQQGVAATPPPHSQQQQQQAPGQNGFAAVPAAYSPPHPPMRLQKEGEEFAAALPPHLQPPPQRQNIVAAAPPPYQFPQPKPLGQNGYAAGLHPYAFPPSLQVQQHSAASLPPHLQQQPLQGQNGYAASAAPCSAARLQQGVAADLPPHMQYPEQPHGLGEDPDSLPISGLSNDAGEYNCFLNTIIQCLWHCHDFRQQVAGWPEFLRNYSPVLRAVHGVFAALEQQEREGGRTGQQPDSRHSVVNPSQLREALSTLPGQLFNTGEMSDAGEVLQTLYEQINAGVKAGAAFGLPPQVDLDGVVGLAVQEHVHCPACALDTHGSSYTQYFYNTPATAIRMLHRVHGSRGAKLGQLLRMIEEQTLKSCDPDKGGCNAKLPALHQLARAPRVFTLQLAWESHREEAGDIAATLEAVSETVDLHTVYRGLAPGRHMYRLRSLVCYYGAHYFAFVQLPGLGAWAKLDDTRVSRVGSWADVKRKCALGRVQPSMLFFEAQS